MLEKQNTLTLTTVQLSGAISLPVLMAGYFVGSHFSMTTAIMQIVFSNILLFVCSFGYASIAFYHKETTVMLARRFFGTRGVVLCALGMLMLMLGWSIIQMQYMTLGLSALFHDNNLLTRIGSALGCCMLVYITIVRGLNHFAKISRVLLPVFIVALSLTLHSAVQIVSKPILTNGSILAGFIIILTTSSGLLYDLPTYYRHASSLKAARLSLSLLFLIFIPGMQVLGMYLASKYSLSNTFESFNTFGLIFFLLSSFLSNCVNWYSAAMICQQFSNFKMKSIFTSIALICFVGALININDSLLPMLEIINIIGEVILCLMLVFLIFNGCSLDRISNSEAKQHTSILYLILFSLLMSRIISLPLLSDTFIATAILSIILMSIYSITRKLR